MRAWASLAILFAIVLALGAWVYYRPASDASQTHALSNLKASDVKRIRVERAQKSAAASAGAHADDSQQVIVLQRENDQWVMTAPIVARAEKFQAERMLSVLDARSSVRYPAADLARFGLDAPQIALTLGDQRFEYGAINNVTREQYILTGGTVFLVPLAYVTALPRSPDALLALRLFAPNEKPVRFDLPEFSAALVDGKWVITPPSGDVSPDERNAWVDAWMNASAMHAERGAIDATLPDIKVQLKDGRTLAFAIVQRQPELVLGRRDEGIVYHLFGENGKRLMSPPTALQKAANKTAQ